MENAENGSMKEGLKKQPNSTTCFACGLANPIGLGLAFYEVGPDEVRAWCTIPKHFEGYPGVVHGGIVATMLDEIAARAVLIGEHNRLRFTAKLDVRYRHPVPSEQALTLRGTVVGRKGRLATAQSALILPDGTVAAEADAILADHPDIPRDPTILESLGWKVTPD